MANVTGAIDYAKLFWDIANLVDLYLDESSLISMVTNLPDLSSVQEDLQKFMKILPHLTDMGDLDYER